MFFFFIIFSINHHIEQSKSTALVIPSQINIHFSLDVKTTFVQFLTANNQRFLFHIQSGDLFSLPSEHFPILSHSTADGVILVTPDGFSFLQDMNGTLHLPQKIRSFKSGFQKGKKINIIRRDHQIEHPQLGLINSSRVKYKLTLPLQSENIFLHAEYVDITYYSRFDIGVPKTNVYLTSFANGTTLIHVNGFNFSFHIGSLIISVKNRHKYFYYQMFHGIDMVDPSLVTLSEFEKVVYAMPGRSLEQPKMKEHVVLSLPGSSSVSSHFFFFVVGSSIFAIYWLLYLLKFFIKKNKDSQKVLYIDRRNNYYGVFDDQLVTIISIKNEDILCKDNLDKYRQRVSRTAHLVHTIFDTDRTLFVYGTVMEPLDFSYVDPIEFIRVCLLWLYKLFGADLAYGFVNTTIFWMLPKKKIEILGIDWAVYQTTEPNEKNKTIRLFSDFFVQCFSEFHFPYTWRVNEIMLDLVQPGSENKVGILIFLRHHAFWSEDDLLQILSQVSSHFNNPSAKKQREMIENRRDEILGCQFWDQELPPELKSEISSRYKNDSVMELLRFLRNKYVHRDELNLVPKQDIPLQIYFFKVISSSFPNLFRHVVFFAQKYINPEYQVKAKSYDPV